MTEEKPRPSVWITVRFVIYGCVAHSALWVITRFAFNSAAGQPNVLLLMLAYPYAYIVHQDSAVYATFLGQYPVYGWILGQAMRRGRFGRSLLWLVGVHAAALVVLLLMGWPGVVGPR